MTTHTANTHGVRTPASAADAHVDLPAQLRIRTHGRLKTTWAVVLNLIFYTGYPLLQHHHLGTVREVPLTWLDRLFVFAPHTTWIYISVLLLMPLPFLWMATRVELHRHALEFLAIMAIAFFIFCLWPTSIPRPVYDSGGLYAQLVAWDSHTNAVPSLHAAFTVHAIVAALRVWTRPLSKLFFVVWGVAIIGSAGFTHQHRALDLLAGAALALTITAIGARIAARRGASPSAAATAERPTA